MKKVLFSLSLFLVPVLLLNYLCVWFIEIPEHKAIRNGTHEKFLKWNAVHNKNNKLDIIILGSSRGYAAYNPVIIDSIVGTNTYNMCTGSQNIIESYYLLKEILRYQKPKYVIYETFFPSFSKEPDYYHVLGNARFMSLKGKLDMMINGFGIDGFLNLVFPVIKYKSYRLRIISSILKQRPAFVNNDIWIKGYLYNKGVNSTYSIKRFPPINTFENSTMSDNQIVFYLNLFKKLCLEHNVRLICVRAPYPPSRLKITYPDTEKNYFIKLYKTDNIIFFDFNDFNDFSISDYDFSDFHHMNYIGANKASVLLSRILIKLEVSQDNGNKSFD
jgi:hypothetical protein